MHWFWRATIAVGAGTVVGIGVYMGCGLLIWRWIGPTASARSWVVALVWSGLTSALACVAALTVYMLSTNSGADGETLCRKCGYILRGISEPRCPECGERI
jgi:hypothetical protein